jgi:hypothetical protein
MFNVFSNSVINKFGVRRLAKIFARKDNWHNLDLNKGNLGYGWIHYGLIRNLKPERILCIGSRYGFIPAVCALACKDNKKGIVDFVDAGYDMNDFNGPGKHWGGLGFWKNCNPKKYFRRFGLEKHIKLYVLTSEDYAKKYTNRKYGFIHIDGDHSYEGVKGDFEMFWPKLCKGGFLAIHDIGSPDKDGNVYGTRDFWNELKRNREFRVIEFNEDPGIGIIQKI